MTSTEATNLYRQPEGTHFKATVTIEYEAVAYEAYDGATRYLLTVNGVEQGSFAPSGLLQISKEWKPLNVEKAPAQTPPNITVVVNQAAPSLAKDEADLKDALAKVEEKTRAKTTTKVKAEPKDD